MQTTADRRSWACKPLFWRLATRIRLATLAELVTLAIVWASCTSTAQAWDPGQRVQWQALETVDGTRIEPEQLSGRYVFLQIWASWCPYCKLQNANLPELQRRWERRSGVLLTVSTDRSEKALRDYLQAKSYRFPVVHASQAQRQWLGKVRSVPTVYIIGPDGSVLRKIEGQMLEEDLFELVDLLPVSGAKPAAQSGP